MIFQRSSVPSSLSGNESSLSTSDFGTPTANYPNTDCNMEKFFAPQSIICQCLPSIYVPVTNLTLLRSRYHLVWRYVSWPNSSNSRC